MRVGTGRDFFFEGIYEGFLEERVEIFLLLLFWTYRGYKNYKTDFFSTIF